MRTLFIYPNFESALRIPLALAIFSAVLKQRGHEVRVFDPTFMSKGYGNDYKLMEARGVVKKTRLEELIGEVSDLDVQEELVKAVRDFAPDVVAFSLLERTYHMFKLMAANLRTHFPELPILVGGILPSIHPDLLVNDPLVDWICVGEGENLMADFADLWPDRSKIERLPNLWYRRGGQVVKNPLGPLVDMATVPDQDWEAFDLRHLYKPFEGNVYMGGSFEWSRGCFNRCSFCVGPSLRRVYHADGQTYHRTKPVAQVIGEIAAKKERYGLTFNAFCDTNFLKGVPLSALREFCAAYKSEVGVPFIIQTSAESISEDKLKVIMDAGCLSASIGVESGSDFIRREVLKKGPSKATLKRCFDLCRAHGFRLTANYMVGLPFETEEHVMDSLRFNRELDPPSIAIHFFSPFLGTALYDVSMKEGFYAGFDPLSSVYKASPLNMPQMSPERIQELVKLMTEDFNSWKREIPVEIDANLAL